MTTVDIKVNIDAARKKIQKIQGSLNSRNLLNAIGLRHLKWINDNFKQEGHLRQSGGWHPLAESTKFARRQGQAKILQDTGRLRQSFVHKIRGTEVSVGTADKKAKWHEFGTSPYTIKPTNANALAFPHTSGKSLISGHQQTRFNGKLGIFTKGVDHPGLEARPMLPTKRIARKLAIDVIKAVIDREINSRRGEV